MYFGDLGQDCKPLVGYFEHHGAIPCSEAENCAEWLLEVVTTSNTEGAIDWPEQWHDSQEKLKIDHQVEEMKRRLLQLNSAPKYDSAVNREFATRFLSQVKTDTRRTFLHDWRTPSYLYSKVFLTVGAVGRPILFFILAYLH